jgi:hypothetical protein
MNDVNICRHCHETIPLHVQGRGVCISCQKHKCFLCGQELKHDGDSFFIKSTHYYYCSFCWEAVTRVTGMYYQDQNMNDKSCNALVRALSFDNPYSSLRSLAYKYGIDVEFMSFDQMVRTLARAIIEGEK